ncbi:PKD-like domain-containing protein, partial [Flavobacterium limnosediminis]|uniref:PKD-like domain-containing protein n=1 Tax=Flavobacterium limnosediminis TaxID=1401027 RepID=UPI0005598DC3
ANLSAQTTYQLVNVSAGSGCSASLSQSVVVTIAPQPTASISGATTVCFNSSAIITFTGTPGATVQYTINGGANQPVILDAAGTATVNTGALTADATYALVDVTAGTVPNCIQAVTGSVTVTVVQTPTVTATPNSQALCSGQSTGIQLQGTVPNTTFSWTYAQTGGVTGASNSTGNIISQVLTAGSVSGTVTYTITPQVGSCTGNPITVTVTVNPVPVVNLNTTTQSICTGGTTNITMSSNVAGTTFNWNVVQNGGVTGGTIGTGTSINDVL